MSKAKPQSTKSPKTQPQTPVPARVPIHPLLLKKEISQISDWHGCLASFLFTGDFGEMIRCLEIGLTVDLNNTTTNYSKDERILFYLSVADGWNNPDSFILPEDGFSSIRIKVKSHCLRNVRAMIAEKAFEMLCNFTFAGVNKRYTGYDPEWTIPMEEFLTGEHSYPVLRAIRNFFRIKKSDTGRDYDIANLTKYGKDEDHDQAVTFLLHLAKFLWKWEERRENHLKYDKKWNDDMRVEIEESKDWMIEVLEKLNKIELLENWLLKLSALDIFNLNRIAMRSMLEKGRHPVSDDRAVDSLDEACRVGSKAGWIIKKYELTVIIEKNLQSAKDLEEKKKDLERQLEELKAQKKK